MSAKKQHVCVVCGSKLTAKEAEYSWSRCSICIGIQDAAEAESPNAELLSALESENPRTLPPAPGPPAPAGFMYLDEFVAIWRTWPSQRRQDAIMELQKYFADPEKYMATLEGK
jgi:hypothetical protein